MDRTIKLIGIFFVLVSLFWLVPVGVRAQTADICNVEGTAYGNNLNTSAGGVDLTAKDIGTANTTLLWTTTSGTGLNQAVGCSSDIMGKMGVDKEDSGFVSCSGTDPDVCQELTGPTTGFAPGEDWLMQFAHRQTSGSLFGLAALTGSFTRNEPIPVSFAFYANDVISRVPFVNVTFAQDTTYGHKLLDSILGAWKAFRNLAYALIAIILLYTGIIIILRRKISSQVVVSVQYALPRIVIAIILITFSYPIGATLGSIGWTLFKSNWFLAASFFRDNVSELGSKGDILAMWTVMIPLFPLIVTGPILLTMMIMIVAVYMLAGIVFNVKAIIIYLKIIFSILTAPIEFAIGAVPGNDDKIKGWFLRMAKYVLTLFGMGMVIPLGTIIAVMIIDGIATEVRGSIGAGARLFAMGLPVFVVLYCFGLGIGMEKRVEEFLGLGQKRR